MEAIITETIHPHLHINRETCTLQQKKEKIRTGTNSKKDIKRAVVKKLLNTIKFKHKYKPVSTNSKYDYFSYLIDNSYYVKRVTFIHLYWN